MKYIEFNTDSNITFNSMHTIDNVEWKPKVKLLNDFDLIFTLNNKINLLCDSDRHTIEPNEAFFAYPGQSVYIHPDALPKTGVSVLHFSAKKFNKKSLNEVREICKENATASSQHVCISTIIKLKYGNEQAILEAMFNELKYCRFGYEIKMNICLRELLFELYRSCAEDIIYGNLEYNYTISNKYTREIINYLHNNYMNEITGKDINDHLQISYDYASQVFKKITGFTIMSYLNNIRIARAKQLIETTSLSIYKIAAIVGIKDPHYFSKKFKSLEGIPPSKYKRE